MWMVIGRFGKHSHAHSTMVELQYSDRNVVLSVVFLTFAQRAFPRALPRASGSGASIWARAARSPASPPPTAGLASARCARGRRRTHGGGTHATARHSSAHRLAGGLPTTNGCPPLDGVPPTWRNNNTWRLIVGHLGRERAAAALQVCWRQSGWPRDEHFAGEGRPENWLEGRQVGNAGGVGAVEAVEAGAGSGRRGKVAGKSASPSLPATCVYFQFSLGPAPPL